MKKVYIMSRVLVLVEKAEGGPISGQQLGAGRWRQDEGTTPGLVHYKLKFRI